MNNYPFVPARHFKQGRIKPIQLIVVHDMEAPEGPLTAENVAHYFATTDVVASAHFCVDNNSVVQLVQLDDTAFHCRNANANGIGVEHAGYARQTREQWLDEYSKATLEQAAGLCAELCKEYNIPVARGVFVGPNDPSVVKPGFCGHRDVPLHGVHSDPGPNFPWDYFLERVASKLAELGDDNPD